MSKHDTHVKINVTPEQLAQAIFAAATPPDPTKRKPRKKRKADEVEEEISYMKRPPESETGEGEVN